MSRIAITGASGFVGRHLAARLAAHGHAVVAVSRRAGLDLADSDPAALRGALQGCEAVVHCAGINREIADQTYERVHVAGTQAVVDAARDAGVKRLVMLSFLRARPDGPTTYHRSKWAAEEIVRASGLSHVIFKAGVIHGRGDHMLDHLSHALFTFPVFGLVGRREQPVRPVAVDDVARILQAAALGDLRLMDRTIAILGPETMALGAAVRRVASAIGQSPRYVRLPIAVHLALAHACEATMHIPLVSIAQVHILAEGVVDPLPFAAQPPDDLAPATPFSIEVIRAGLPPPGRFGCRDLRWCRA